MPPIVVAITGASGSIYAIRLLEALLTAGRSVHLTISPAAAQVLEHELGLRVDLNRFQPQQLFPEQDSSIAQKSLLFRSRRLDRPIPTDLLQYHHYADYWAGIASGSFLTDGMVICPCSTGTLAAVASGQSQNLIHRAADVHFKERRKLILVPRETPLSVITLGNMKRLAEVGAVILPAAPGFYHEPQSVSDLIDFVVARICDQLAVAHNLSKRWGTSS
ncbi:MAG: flavin prenyltransferase UbiX [Planctomycetaceae bacterium]